MRTPAILAVVLGLACGGQREPSRRSETKTPRKAAALREAWCTLRVSAKGIYVDGEPEARDAAVTACKRAAGALVVLEPDASRELWSALEAQLRREHVAIRMRGTLDDNDCTNNPLAKGCS